MANGFYFSSDRSDYDYHQFNYNGLSLRGPKPASLEPKSYIVCIGASQTFGRYCHNSYPHLLSKKINYPVLNLGVGGAGISLFYKNPKMMDIINNSSLVIVQCMSARAENNSRLRTSNGRCVMIDTKNAHMEHIDQQMLNLKSEGLTWDQFVQLKMESRKSYFDSHVEFANSIKVPSLLFWFSRVRPLDNVIWTYHSLSDIYGEFPHWVDRCLYWDICRLFDKSTNCVIDDIPTTGKDPYYFPQEMMNRAADHLNDLIRREFLPVIIKPKYPAELPVRTPIRNLKPHTDEDVCLWILTIGRNGSTYLSGILNNLLDIHHPLFEEHLNGYKRPYMFFYKRTKMMMSRFNEYYNSDNMTELLSHYPQMKFVHQTRDDTIGQAVSFYLAHKLNKWTIEKNEQKTYEEMGDISNINDESLYGQYRFCQKAPSFFQEITSHIPPHSIFNIEYESLNTDPHNTVKNLLSFLKVDKSDEQISKAIESVQTVPMIRKETAILRERLEQLIAEGQHKEKPQTILQQRSFPLLP